MKKLIETLKNIYKIEDLRSRLGLTLLLIAVYRFGSFVILPGIDPNPANFESLKSQTSDGILGLLAALIGDEIELSQLQELSSLTKNSKIIL